MADWLIKAGFLLLLLAVLTLWTLNYMGWRKVKAGWPFYAFLLLAGVGMTVYVRGLVHSLSIPYPSDEAQYVGILGDLAQDRSVPVSGPGYVYCMQFLHFLLPGSDYANIVAISGAVLGCLYLLAIYLGYRRSNKGELHAMAAILLLMTSSYFLWPMLEGRPQQLGMLIAFFGMLLFHRYLKDGKYAYVFFIVLTMAFFYHILTFLILSGTCLLLWWWGYAKGNSPILRGIPLGGAILSGLVLFSIGGFIYGPMSGGLEWSFSGTKVSFLTEGYVLIPLAIGILALAIPLTWAVKRYGVLPRVENFAQGHALAIAVIAGVATIGALGVQFYLNYDIYMDKYHRNIPYFVLLSLGNLAFGALFIAGATSMMKEEKTDIYLRATLAMMLLGALVLPLSVMLPEGFNDWFIRIINYWTIFAAPVAVRPLAWAGPKTKVAIMILIPILIVLSLINISRDPSILGYP